MLDYNKVQIVEEMLEDADNKDGMIKYLIQEADFEVAYYLVCKYVTKRSVMDLHKSIISNISGSKSTLDLAPRGFGKSTVGDVDYCITKILRDPDIRIMIGSKTQTQAQAFLKEVRTHFEQNEDLIRIFGDWKTSKDNIWNDREFTVNKRKVIKKEATLTALGASGAVISKHFDIIIGDDLVGLENARTEKQRANLKEWFYSSLFPTLEPDGEIHILGTRYNPLDLYEDLIKSKSYVVNIQQAIRTVGGKKVSLWESKFTLESWSRSREIVVRLFLICNIRMIQSWQKERSLRVSTLSIMRSTKLIMISKPLRCVLRMMRVLINGSRLGCVLAVT